MNEELKDSKTPAPVAVASGAVLGRRVRIFKRFVKYLIYITGVLTLTIPIMLGVCVGLDWLLGKWMILVPIGMVAGFCFLGAWAEESTNDKSA